MLRLAFSFLALLIFMSAPVWSQSIETEGDIETAGQLVSTVTTGTPPLDVSSKTKVVSLNADLLDGHDHLHFATFQALYNSILLLDSPDPPCFSDSYRFVDCGNGTVTDTVTGLIWLKDAGCFNDKTYANSNADAALLWDGATEFAGGDCGLSDGSRLGEWRLATREEWRTILDNSCASPPRIMGNGSPDMGCHSDNPWATDVQMDYWTMEGSYSDPDGAIRAYKASTASGTISIVYKDPPSATCCKGWPVRGPSRGGE